MKLLNPLLSSVVTTGTKELTPNHRVIGKLQKLFFFHPSSPGSCFFLSRGFYIYNTLIEFMRSELKQQNFQEILTPTIYNCRLWEESGHWHHYKDKMFSFNLNKTEQYGLKPMNCPGHCLVFKEYSKSYKHLPLKLCEFAALHRNESSGGITGLTRVRKFHQDDVHIFCSPSQIETQVSNSIDLIKKVYELFGLKYQFFLSTRPKSCLGEFDMWLKAEETLKTVLDKTVSNWEVNEGDGAFYGPKIDVKVNDSTGKLHQCATIQLDFQLPIKFNLSYTSEDATQKRPIIIHRAIYGSIERFIAILCENYDGNWPFWVSPLQAQIIPITPDQIDYAEYIAMCFKKEYFNVDLEREHTLSLKKKIREAEITKYNFIVCVGKQEAANGTANVRFTLNKQTHQIVMSVDKLVNLFKRFRESRCKDAEREMLAAN